MASDHTHLRDLFQRFTRLVASEGWDGDLNPTQRAALLYLTRANRFSRTPSHVADYLTATRGTVSQTLKALRRKGLIEEVPSATDKRSFSYTPTADGVRLVSADDRLAEVLATLSGKDATDLSKVLVGLISGMLEQRGGRSFGVCRTCSHHEVRGDAGYCKLIAEPLTLQDGDALCHEHENAEAA